MRRGPRRPFRRVGSVVPGGLRAGRAFIGNSVLALGVVSSTGLIVDGARFLGRLGPGVVTTLGASATAPRPLRSFVPITGAAVSPVPGPVDLGPDRAGFDPSFDPGRSPHTTEQALARLLDDHDFGFGFIDTQIVQGQVDGLGHRLCRCLYPFHVVRVPLCFTRPAGRDHAPSVPVRPNLPRFATGSPGPTGPEEALRWSSNRPGCALGVFNAFACSSSTPTVLFPWG